MDQTAAAAQSGPTGHAIVQSYLKTLDGSPGVYRMLDAQARILYVGKPEMEEIVRVAALGARCRVERKCNGFRTCVSCNGLDPDSTRARTVYIGIFIF